MQIKRLFFAFQVESLWPPLPEGRKLAETARHMTVAFLGNIDYEKLQPHLAEIPLPKLKVGTTGVFINSHQLPAKHPHVVAWELSFLEQNEIELYVEKLTEWLASLQIISKKHHRWLPHVTITRKPFNSKEWEEAFRKIVFKFDTLHLYESFPELKYEPIWSYSMIKPFEPIAHTADIAYIVRGETIEQLFENAFHALCFTFPELLKYKPKTPNKAEEIVPSLNLAIAHADSEIGCPFKAVSYHGEIKKKSEYYEWEMIVDV